MKLNDMIFLAMQDIKNAAASSGLSINDKTVANLLTKVIEDHKNGDVTVKSLSDEINAGFKFASIIESIGETSDTRKAKTVPQEGKRPVGRPKKLTQSAPIVTPPSIKRGVGRPKKNPELQQAANSR